MEQNTDLLYQNSDNNVTWSVQNMEFDQEKLYIENGQEELPRPETVTVSVMQEEFVEGSNADFLFTPVSDPLDVDPLHVEENIKPEPSEIIKREPRDENDNQEVPESEEENIGAEVSNSASKLHGEKDVIQNGSPCNELSVNSDVRDSNCLNESDLDTVADSYCFNESDLGTVADSNCLNESDLNTVADSNCLNESDLGTVADSNFLNESDLDTVADSNCLNEYDLGTVADKEPTNAELTEKPNSSFKTFVCEDERIVEEADSTLASESASVSKELTDVQVRSPVDECIRETIQNANREPTNANTSQYKVSATKANPEGKLVVLLTRCKVTDKLLCDSDPSSHSVNSEACERLMPDASGEEDENLSEETMMSEDEFVDIDASAEKTEKSTSLGVASEKPSNLSLDEIPLNIRLNIIGRKENRDTSSGESNLEAARCADCHKIFNSKGSLAGHRPRCIERKRKAKLCMPRKPSVPERCSLCGKHFNTRSSLLNHMTIHHSNDTITFKCHVCEQGFSTSTDLKEHSLVHMSIEQYDCEVCDQIFESLRALRIHKTKIHYRSNKVVRKITDPAEVQSNAGHDLFPCETCNQAFPTSADLNKHKVIHNEQVFNSRIGLPLSNSLGHGIISENMQINVSNKTKQIGSLFHCKICNEVFNTCQSLNDHGIIHAKQLLQPYLEGTAQFSRRGNRWSCPVCARTFASKRNVQDHVGLHLNTKPYSCHICKKSFNQKGSVKNHIKKWHPEEETFPCEICGMVFYSSITLRMHKRKHKQSHQFLCSYCGRFLSSRQHLIEHKCSSVKQRLLHSSTDKVIQTSKLQVKTHTGKPYQCHLCKERFSSSFRLNNHVCTQHSHEIPYKCKGCERPFSRADSLSRHQQVCCFHEIPYKCKGCERPFSRSDSLSRHQQVCRFRKLLKERVVHKPKLPSSEQEYRCEDCNTKYTALKYLKRHNNKYHPTKKTEPKFLLKSSGKRFPCDICGQTCTNFSNLKEHCNRFHSEMNENMVQKSVLEGPESQFRSSGKNYKCNYCNSGFSNTGNLSRHVRSIHNDGDKVVSTFHKHISQIGVEKFKCYHCDSTFTTLSNMQRHSYRFHQGKESGKEGLQSQTNENGYKCYLCDLVCSNLRNLEDHIHYVHKGQEKEITALQSPTKEKMWECDFCDYTCSKLNTLKKHYYVKHTDKRNLQISKKVLSQSSKFCSIDKKFKCYRCNMRFISRSFLQSHIQKHHRNYKGKVSAMQSNSRNQLYKCDLCDLVCSTLKNLQVHNYYVHKGQEKEITALQSPTEEEMCKCDFCDYTCSNKNTLQMHCYRKHQVERNLQISKKILSQSSKFCSIDKKFKCCRCNMKFISRSYLQRHIHKHHRKYKGKVSAMQSNSRNQLYKCDLCDLTCPSHNSLLNHISISHNKNGNLSRMSSFTSKSVKEMLSCDKCKGTFNDIHHLIGHTCNVPNLKTNGKNAFVETSRKTYQCNRCGDSFLLKYKLREHNCNSYVENKTHHESELSKQYKKDSKKVCLVCRESFTLLDELKEHMLVHTTQEPSFDCLTCSATFPSLRELRKHSKIHGLRKPVESSVSSLKFNNETETSGKNDCVLCDKVFSSSASLKRHMMIHTGLHPYPCNECSSSFRERNKLVRHMKMRHGIDCNLTPFYCIICKKQFSKKGYLLKHLSSCN